MELAKYCSKLLVLLSIPFFAASCGDERTIIVEPDTPEQVTIYANVQGLPEFRSIKLSANGITKRVIADGVTELVLVPQGEAYTVDLSCDIANGQGTAQGSDVRNVKISCSDIDASPEIVLDNVERELNYSPGERVFTTRFDIREYEGQELTVSVEVVKQPEGSNFYSPAELVHAPRDSFSSFAFRDSGSLSEFKFCCRFLWKI